MSSKWRRYEVLLPLQRNDGTSISAEELGRAVMEIVDRFGAASHETNAIEGHWVQGGIHYRDNLGRVVVDVEDSSENRAWMRDYKERWRHRLEELELWMISHPIDLE